MPVLVLILSTFGSLFNFLWFIYLSDYLSYLNHFILHFWLLVDFLDQGGLQNIPLDRCHTFPTVLSYTSSKASLSYSIRTFDQKKYKRACVCVLQEVEVQIHLVLECAVVCGWNDRGWTKDSCPIVCVVWAAAVAAFLVCVWECVCVGVCVCFLCASGCLCPLHLRTPGKV